MRSVNCSMEKDRLREWACGEVNEDGGVMVGGDMVVVDRGEERKEIRRRTA